jgi:hypothetical protein
MSKTFLTLQTNLITRENIREKIKKTRKEEFHREKFPLYKKLKNLHLLGSQVGGFSLVRGSRCLSVSQLEMTRVQNVKVLIYNEGDQFF